MLKKSGADLDACLADVDGKNFTHSGSIKKLFP
jgi:hypothetical protein